MDRSNGSGVWISAMFLGWPFAQLVQNHGVAERPFLTAVLAFAVVSSGYFCVFRPVAAGARAAQISGGRSLKVLRGAVAIVLLVLIAAVCAYAADAWRGWTMATGRGVNVSPLLLAMALATGVAAVGRLNAPFLGRIVLMTSCVSGAILLGALVWFASRPEAPQRAAETYWSWTLDGFAYMFPAIAFAGAVSATVRPDHAKGRLSIWVICAASYSVTLSLLIQEAAMSGYSLNQLDQLGTFVDISDSEEHIWKLFLSLTGVGPAIVAAFALRELAGRSAPWLILAATWAWSLEREMGSGEGVAAAVLISSLLLSLTWVYLAGGFLFGTDDR